MVDKEINSYDFYVKNFPYIKYSIDDKFKNQTNNILLVIIYDQPLYEKYIEIKKENDFKELIKNEFMESECYNNEDEGVFLICGDLVENVDLIINNVFGKERKLEKEELKSIGIDEGMKNSYNFYISLIKIHFFYSKGEMSFKFNEIKRQLSNEDNVNI